ncbi:MAG: methyltransferase domain-containing protein [Patescibacteria group bacterium]
MEKLVEHLKKIGALKTPEIIKAFLKIDRRDFVPKSEQSLAYLDDALSIGYGQTISQPYTVAFMLELLQPKTGQKILDIGSGSGWQSALLANIVGKEGRVYAVEIIPELSRTGQENALKYGFEKEGILKFIEGSAAHGLPKEGPYDRIIAAAAGDKIPAEWTDELSPSGRLVAPVKHSIVLIEKDKGGYLTETEFPGFAFVPLVG